MANTLDTFDLADPIFVDANIFLFHAFAHPQRGDAARRFLERVELAQVNAVTSVLVVNEVLFKVLLQEAALRLERPIIWNVRRALRDDPAFREQLYRPAQQYLHYIEALTRKGLALVDVTVDQMRHAVDLGRRFGLLITDATHVATWQAHKIAHVATDDEDLWRQVPGVTAWGP
jgi:predicted nucleic acid-binding protein